MLGHRQHEHIANDLIVNGEVLACLDSCFMTSINELRVEISLESEGPEMDP